MERDVFNDILLNLNGCLYISDLKPINKDKCQQLLVAIKSMDYKKYSLKQWEAVFDYLLSYKVCFKTRHEAYENIIEELTQKF